MRLRHFIVAIVSLAGLLFSVDAALASKVDIIISKVSQKMTVKVDGSTEYVWPVSTGAPGYDTPSGTFRPFRMEADHFSKEWDDAPMPHSIFFTGQGHAIHGSFHVKSLGRKASHGCVRLSPENAAILYDLVQKNGMQNTSVTLKAASSISAAARPRARMAAAAAGGWATSPSAASRQSATTSKKPSTAMPTRRSPQRRWPPSAPSRTGKRSARSPLPCSAALKAEVSRPT